MDLLLVRRLPPWHRRTEIDLLLTPPGERPWAIEIKRSLSPSLERGFDLASEGVEAIGVSALASLLRERAPSLT